MKRLIEQVALVAPVHEDGVQGPVKVFAGANPHRIRRLKRPDDLAGPDRQAGSPQNPGEMHDVLRQPTAAVFGPFGDVGSVERHVSGNVRICHDVSGRAQGEGAE